MVWSVDMEKSILINYKSTTKYIIPFDLYTGRSIFFFLPDTELENWALNIWLLDKLCSRIVSLTWFIINKVLHAIIMD